MDVTSPLIPVPLTQEVEQRDLPEDYTLADEFICLRGPCQHYMDQVEPADVHNPEAGLIQRTRTCLLLQSDLTEATVHDCNRWEPRGPIDQAVIDTARADYWAKNPRHAPEADSFRLSTIRRVTK